jgi:hypothetical protein
MQALRAHNDREELCVWLTLWRARCYKNFESVGSASSPALFISLKDDTSLRHPVQIHIDVHDAKRSPMVERHRKGETWLIDVEAATGQLCSCSP